MLETIFYSLTAVVGLWFASVIVRGWFHVPLFRFEHTFFVSWYK